MKRDETYGLCPNIKSEVFTSGVNEIRLAMVCDRNRGHKGECEHRVALPWETRWLTLVNDETRRHVVVFPECEP